MTADELERILLDPETEVTAATLAGLFDCSQRTVTALAKSGVVVRSGRGRYRLLASCVNRNRNLADVAAGRRGEGELDLVAERAALARSQRIAVDLKVAERLGQVVQIDDVVAAISGQFLVVRNRLLQLPSFTASRLPSGARQAVFEIMTTEIHRALEELSADREFAEQAEAVRDAEERTDAEHKQHVDDES